MQYSMQQSTITRQGKTVQSLRVKNKKVKLADHKSWQYKLPPRINMVKLHRKHAYYIPDSIKIHE